MNRSRLVWFALIVVAIIGAGGVWLKAQPRTVTGQFDGVGADPAYIVVGTSTPVLFTAKITDPQLKKRSVVLLKLDSAGKPSDILGRLRDDGKNGDVTAGDSIYSIRTPLNEPAVGTVNFQVAARFKPGRWSEPEADDDDWDRELTTLGQTGRDRPARQERLSGLMRRLSRYTRSGPIVVTVDPFKLPPDPGEAGKQTLEGTDSDNDGVRDDIQRWIALSMTSARTRAALGYVASAKQALLTTNASDTTSLRTAVATQLASTRCLISIRGAAVSYELIEQLDTHFLDTSSRQAANDLVQDAVSSSWIDSPALSSLGTFCLFDPDTLPD